MICLLTLFPVIFISLCFVWVIIIKRPYPLQSYENSSTFLLLHLCLHFLHINLWPHLVSLDTKILLYTGTLMSQTLCSLCHQWSETLSFLCIKCLNLFGSVSGLLCLTKRHVQTGANFLNDCMFRMYSYVTAFLFQSLPHCLAPSFFHLNSKITLVVPGEKKKKQPSGLCSIYNLGKIIILMLMLRFHFSLLLCFNANRKNLVKVMRTDS